MYPQAEDWWMEAENPFLSQIRDDLRRDRLVPVVGAGVSAGAAGLPGWLDAVRMAIGYLRRTPAADRQALDRAEELLTAGRLIPAASSLADELKDLNEWAAWLRSTFRVGEEEVTDWSALRALFALMCPVIATTNYDKILSFNPLQTTQSMSWDQPAAMQAALRDGRSVLHLHGSWDRPRSVVFGTSDYERLVGTDAYQSVLRTLWLDRTLLFVGCSFDGLQDPDLGRLLEWAFREFGQSQFRHYALLEAGTYDQEQARYLLRHRIHVIDYGPGHSRLPEALRDLNPYGERALTATANRVRELLDRQEPADVPRLRQLLAELLPAAQKAVDVPGAATALLQPHSASSDRFRQELFRLQSIAGTLIDRERLGHLIGQLDPYGNFPEDEKESVRTAVLQAGRAFSLFPNSLLVALKQRGVALHPAVPDGWAGRYMKDLSQWAGINPVLARKWGVPDPLDHAYSRENMHRVLSALREILATDPFTVFPASAPGLGVAPEGPSIIVTRGDRIEIRSRTRPEARSSVLAAGSPGLLGIQPVKLGGNLLLVGYSNSAVLAWNPRESLDPARSYEVNESSGINSVTHVDAPDGLHTYVLTDQTVHHLVDLTLRDQSSFMLDSDLADITALPGHQLLCRHFEPDGVVRLHPDAAPTRLLDHKSLLSELRRRQALGANELITIAGLDVAHAGPRVLAAIRILIDRPGPQRYEYQSGSVLCEVTATGLRPVAFFRVPAEDLFSTRLLDLGDGSFRVLCGIRPERSATRPMVFWSTPCSPGGDFTLAVAGSAVEIEAPWAAVSWLDQRSALAGTGDTLWSIDIETGVSTVIDRGQGRPIRSVDLVNW